MELLYSKLYDKYTKLKTRRDSEMEQLTRDQEVKFMSYVSAAEDQIEHLRNENDRLHALINNLTNELASIRSAKDGHYAEYQELLMEENRKNKELSEEVEKLCNLQREALCCSTKDDKNENRQLGTPSGGTEVGSRDLSYGSTRKMTRKRTRHAMVLAEGARVNPHASGQVEKALVRDPETYSYKGTLSNDALKNIQQPECCRRNISSSGGGIYDAGPANCMFQALMGCLVGMKLSMVNQTEGICVSALHQSSGYSFSLTWVSTAAGEEAELVYRVSSLGTFERVAPEWMREVLMFSTRMCPIFFERVSRVIKLNH